MKKITVLIATAGTLLVLLSGVALAATINGTAGNDTLRGTNSADVLHGRGGADTISGIYGKDRVYGDSGNDLVYVADGSLDSVSCGLGTDTAFVDAADLSRQSFEDFVRLSGCENVSVR